MCIRWELQFWSGFETLSNTLDQYNNIHVATRVKELRGAGNVEYESKCLRNLKVSSRIENYRVQYFECRGSYYIKPQCHLAQVAPQRLVGNRIKPFCEGDPRCKTRVAALAQEFHNVQRKVEEAERGGKERWEKVNLAKELIRAWKEWVEIYRCHSQCPHRRHVDADVKFALQMRVMPIFPTLGQAERMGPDPTRIPEPMEYTKFT